MVDLQSNGVGPFDEFLKNSSEKRMPLKNVFLKTLKKKQTTWWSQNISKTSIGKR